MNGTQSPVLSRRIEMLMLTHKCNLNCLYCHQNHNKRSPKSMTLNMAKEIIKNIFDRNIEKTDELVIEFIGGEVFTEWNLFKNICEWLMGEVRPIEYTIFVSTNGTLLNDEIKAWLRKNKEKVVLSISIDGDSGMQETNRHTSNYTIDIDFFLETWPKQGVKMTLSDATIDNLSRGVISLHRDRNIGFGMAGSKSKTQNKLISCNLATGIDYTYEHYLSLKRELAILLAFYLGKPYAAEELNEVAIDGSQYDRASILDFDFSFFKFNKENALRFSDHCDAGRSMLCYDIDGRTYPCYYFSPLTLEDDLVQKLPNFDFSANNRDPSCKDCEIETICPTCFGNNLKHSGNPFIRDKRMCELTKLILKANCVLQAKLILSKQSKTPMELYTLKVIQYLYPIINDSLAKYEKGHS